VSQYRHHRAQGTEDRSLEDALLDPGSQYVARGRYFERLAPFLENFERDRIAVLAHEELLADRRTTLRSVFEFLGVDDDFWSGGLELLWHTSEGDTPSLCKRLRDELADAFGDDAQRVREFAGREFAGWSV
jgi:Sulfotransferase domain